MKLAGYSEHRDQGSESWESKLVAEVLPHLPPERLLNGETLKYEITCKSAYQPDRATRNVRLRTDEKDITKSSVEATIDVASIDTRVADRDNDLKSDHFFDLAKFPTMTFKSKKILKSGEKLSVTGDLTMHGVTREVTLESDGLTAAVADPWGNTRRGLSASTKVNRQDFGVKWGGTLAGGELVVDDEVKISLDIELVKKK